MAEQRPQAPDLVASVANPPRPTARGTLPPGPTDPRACHPDTHCPTCLVRLVPEHTHAKCPKCGYRDSCCF